MGAFSRTAVVVLVALALACGGSGFTEPTITSAAPPSPPTSPFPALSGPSRTFVFQRELFPPAFDYTKHSHFVLYDNGAFVLQYPSGEYRGGYTQTGNTITFGWEGSSIASPWVAVGTLASNTLTVRYNIVMVLSDFEDAVYVHTP